MVEVVMRFEESRMAEVFKELLAGLQGVNMTTEAISVDVKKEQGTYTLEEVRASLARLCQLGKRSDAQQLVAAYGAKRVTEVCPSYYGEIIRKAGEIV